MSKRKFSSERRQRIIEVAERLFTHFGYEKTTLDDIAREVGVGRTLIYLEFSSKEDVLLSTVEGILLEKITRMKEIAAQPDLPKMVILRELLIYNVLFAHRKCSRWFDPVTLDNFCRRVRQELAGLLAEKQTILAEVIVSAVATNELPSPTEQAAPALAEALLNACMCFLPPNVFSYTQEEALQKASLMIHLLLTGLSHGYDPNSLKGLPENSI